MMNITLTQKQIIILEIVVIALVVCMIYYFWKRNDKKQTIEGFTTATDLESNGVAKIVSNIQRNDKNLIVTTIDNLSYTISNRNSSNWDEYLQNGDTLWVYNATKLYIPGAEVQNIMYKDCLTFEPGKPYQLACNLVEGTYNRGEGGCMQGCRGSDGDGSRNFCDNNVNTGHKANSCMTNPITNDRNIYVTTSLNTQMPLYPKNFDGMTKVGFIPDKLKSITGYTPLEKNVDYNNSHLDNTGYSHGIGSNVSHTYSDVSATECSEKCNEFPSCRAFAINNNQCTLRDELFTTNKKLTNGMQIYGKDINTDAIKNENGNVYKRYPYTDLAGNDLLHMRTKNEGECSLECDKNTNCKSFLYHAPGRTGATSGLMSWQGTSGSNCLLKNTEFSSDDLNDKLNHAYKHDMFAKLYQPIHRFYNSTTSKHRYSTDKLKGQNEVVKGFDVFLTYVNKEGDMIELKDSVDNKLIGYVNTVSQVGNSSRGIPPTQPLYSATNSSGNVLLTTSKMEFDDSNSKGYFKNRNTYHVPTAIEAPNKIDYGNVPYDMCEFNDQIYKSDEKWVQGNNQVSAGPADGIGWFNGKCPPENCFNPMYNGKNSCNPPIHIQRIPDSQYGKFARISIWCSWHEPYFSGNKRIDLPPGRYALADLIAMGIPDNNISEIFPNGTTVIVYDTPNFTGLSRTFTKNTGCLNADDINLNDKISSLIIEAPEITTTTKPVITEAPTTTLAPITTKPGMPNLQYQKHIRLHQECKNINASNNKSNNASSETKGYYHDLEPGNYSEDQLKNILISKLTDNTLDISRIEGNGLRYILYEHPQLQTDPQNGRILELGGNVDCMKDRKLGISTWQNRIRGIKVLGIHETFPSERSKFARIIQHCPDNNNYSSSYVLDLKPGSYTEQDLLDKFPLYKPDSISTVIANNFDVFLYKTANLSGNACRVNSGIEPVCLSSDKNPTSCQDMIQKVKSIRIMPKGQTKYGDYKHYPGWDITGYDFVGMPLKNVSEPRCRDLCEERDKCRGFSHYKDNDINYCWLKDNEKIKKACGDQDCFPSMNSHKNADAFIRNTAVSIIPKETIPVSKNSADINAIISNNDGVLNKMEQDVKTSLNNYNKNKLATNLYIRDDISNLADSVVNNLSKLGDQVNMELYMRKH